MNVEKLIRDYANLKITKRKFYKTLNSIGDLGWDLYKDFQSQITKAEKYRAMAIKDRNMEVVYLCGPSGSGKTTFGKYIADKLGYDPFVSGSGEDFLDGYDKEECIILDDFRAGTMKFAELLKMLDNNTNSSIRSRYYNKDISNCKLLFITSVIPPNQLYSFFKNDDGSENSEPIEQLYRRLKHHYYYINSNGLIEEVSLGTEQVTLKPYMDMSVVYEYFNIDKDKVDDNSIMSQFRTKEAVEDVF